MINFANDKPARLALLGECMVEYLAAAPDVPHAYAGDTCNTAVYLRRLLAATEAKISYITALGDDAISRDMLAAWQLMGIDTALVSCIAGKAPGRYTIVTAADGERGFHYDRTAAAVRDLFRATSSARLSAALQGYTLFYLSGISMAILSQAEREQLYDLVKRLHAAHVSIVFDSNYRPVLWSSVQEARCAYAGLYPYVSLALVSYADESAVFADSSPLATAERIASLGVPEIVVKNGAEPCTVKTTDAQQTYPVKQPAQHAVQDTTAAGDSFNAAYISARLGGYDIATAIAAAQRLSAQVIQFPGAIIPEHHTPTLAHLTADDNAG